MCKGPVQEAEGSWRGKQGHPQGHHVSHTEDMCLFPSGSGSFGIICQAWPNYPGEPLAGLGEGQEKWRSCSSAGSVGQLSGAPPEQRSSGQGPSAAPCPEHVPGWGLHLDSPLIPMCPCPAWLYFLTMERRRGVSILTSSHVYSARAFVP